MTTITAHKTQELVKMECSLSGDITLTNAFDECIFGSTGTWNVEIDTALGLDTSGGYYEVKTAGDYYINCNFNYQNLSGLAVLEFLKHDASGNLYYIYRALRTDTQANQAGYIFMNCVEGDRLSAKTFTNGAGSVIEGDLGSPVRKTVFQIRQLPNNHTF